MGTLGCVLLKAYCSFHSVRKLGFFFWQCCDLHAVLMPHRGETWKLNLPNEEEKTFHIDTQPSKCTGICHFFCLASHAACHILRLHSFYFL